MSKTLDRLLAPFRKREALEDLASVVDDPNAIRLIGSWARIEKEWRSPRGKAPTEDVALWWYLWRGVSFDRGALANSAKLSEQAVHSLLRTCVNARIVYPDGSLSQHAAKLVADHVANRMPGVRRDRPPGVRDSKQRKRKPKPKKKAK